jgi:hypothetical protein
MNAFYSILFLFAMLHLLQLLPGDSSLARCYYRASPLGGKKKVVKEITYGAFGSKQVNDKDGGRVFI